VERRGVEREVWKRGERLAQRLLDVRHLWYIITYYYILHCYCLLDVRHLLTASPSECTVVHVSTMPCRGASPKRNGPPQSIEIT